MSNPLCQIHVLDLGTVQLDSSFLVLGRNPGVKQQVPVYAYVIFTGDDLILVDTGFRSCEIMKRVGMLGVQQPENTLESQLDAIGLAPNDITMIIQTHLHIDHAGRTDLFPMSIPVVLDRSELAFSVCGIGGYQPEDIKHLIDRVHTPKALRFLDLQLTGPITLAPGVRCIPARGHTQGSLIVDVTTKGGQIAICGDLLYDVEHQVIKPHQTKILDEPRITGNHSATKIDESAAIKRLLNEFELILPSHDAAARISNGRVVARPEFNDIEGVSYGARKTSKLPT
jgi:glyoxylase-like metal-dependent hydrolase (beta-lactamase superfamily II)